MLTCYDYSFARLLNGRVDMLLVGDSLGNVILGYPRTTHVTLQDMIRHTAAVRRGAPDTFLVADLPAGSYKVPEKALESAHLLVEAGADAVKPEGRADIVAVLSSAGYTVMGHLGYLPQSEKSFRVVGRDESEAEQILAAAQSMQTAGAFSVVLECLPSQLAARITSR
ncbi:MAG: 3-methyl-2-oxobutanoate hydroxymethyltransferase, partial [candidate division KSB1 bacterium]|nr:3-methyl-2-oxobutanoate hydroxymethyltransferase [candidate division KSB1 bacterium]